MDFTKFKIETEKTSNKETKFISLTDEWKKLSFDMTKEPKKKVTYWNNKKLTKVGDEKNARVHWLWFTIEGKICSLTEYQTRVFLDSLPDIKNVPDIYTCELKIGLNEKSRTCLKVRHI
ncbi:MAG: hypothetical protein LBC85_12265 [Fibromonadaceae bacterium]|jgi:ketosteroid isomerase-like protein|nr:hypothetical protein [Fibromonadaceae bacterium]